MTPFPNSPKPLKSGIALIDTVASAVRRNVALQYNPGSISRTLQARAWCGVGGEMQLGRQFAQSVYGGIGHE